jgi:hypothetical protein
MPDERPTIHSKLRGLWQYRLIESRVRWLTNEWKRDRHSHWVDFLSSGVVLLSLHQQRNHQRLWRLSASWLTLSSPLFARTEVWTPHSPLLQLFALTAPSWLPWAKPEEPIFALWGPVECERLWVLSNLTSEERRKPVFQTSGFAFPPSTRYFMVTSTLRSAYVALPSYQTGNSFGNRATLRVRLATESDSEGHDDLWSTICQINKGLYRTYFLTIFSWQDR